MNDKSNTQAMETEKIPRLLVQLAIPAVVAQIINLLYNIVDRIYIGHIPGVGAAALTGVGLFTPILMLINACAMLAGSGGAPRAAISMGKKDNKTAEKILGNCFVILLLMAVALTVLFFAFAPQLLTLFGASDQTLPYGVDYARIYILGSIFVLIVMGMNPFINAQGFGKTGMFTVVIGAVINIVLDPIFIFLMDMGVKGAALATVIAQGVSAVWVLQFLTGRRSILKLRRRCLPLQGKRVRRIIALGLSGFCMNMTNSLVQVVCNATLQFYGGDLYVGIMTIINSVREVFFMPVHGLTNGSQPVMGYNYGAGKYGRVRQSIRFGCGLTVAYAAAFWALAMAFPGLMIQIFNDEPEVIQAGIPALRIYFALFIPMSLQSAGQAVFVALGRSKQAVFFSLLRKAIINAPLTVILPIWIGTNGVFIAEAVSQLVGGLACFVTMYCTVYRPLGRLKDDTPLPARR